MTTPASLSPGAIRRLTLSSDPWLSCDDCFDLLDEVIEETLSSGAGMREAFRVHLRACTVCCQEAYSLATLVAPDLDIGPGLAVAKLDAVLDDGAPRRP